jgi:hypothetical protein
MGSLATVNARRFDKALAFSQPIARASLELFLVKAPLGFSRNLPAADPDF